MREAYVPNDHVLLMPHEAPELRRRDGTFYRIRINLKNLWVRKKYDDYKRKNGMSFVYPMTVEQREDFEGHMLAYIAHRYEKRYKKRLTYPCYAQTINEIDQLCKEL